MNEGTTYFLLGDRVTQAQAGNQLQDTFVAACGQGDVEQMTRLLEQGAAIDVPNAAGQYPLLACLGSCKMPAIELLNTWVLNDGGQAWQRVQLDDLKAQLSGQRVAPLPANVTYGQLAERFKADRARLEAVYDLVFGVGEYLQDSAVVGMEARCVASGVDSEPRHRIGDRYRAAVKEANRGIETVMAYARAALERPIIGVTLFHRPSNF